MKETVNSSVIAGKQAIIAGTRLRKGEEDRQARAGAIGVTRWGVRGRKPWA
jgi:hypothetical protein